MPIPARGERCVFIDECGHTGEDLFNVDQPVFCLASVYLSEEECTNIKNEYFVDVRADELKHSSLASSSRNRQKVLAFLNGMAGNSSGVKFSIAHKRYVLITKMVDLLIEPLAHEDEVDFYQEGANIAFSNMLYYATLDLLGEKFLTNMMLKFQQMIRGKTRKGYDDFFGIFVDKEFDKVFEDLFVFFKYFHLKQGVDAISALPEQPLDISVSQAFTLVAKWSSVIDGTFVVVHDQSSAMSKGKDIWDRVVSPDVPEETVGRDRRIVNFPIRVSHTGLSDSRQSNGLQLADVLAGAMTRSLKWEATGQNSGDKYGAELSSIFSDVFDVLPIWPQQAFTPEALGTTGPPAKDIIDHFIQLTKDLL